MKLTKDQATYKQAQKIIQEGGKEFAYNLATDLLHNLYLSGYCAFQAYTREDIAAYIGMEVTDEKLEIINDNMDNLEEFL